MHRASDSCLMLDYVHIINLLIIIIIIIIIIKIRPWKDVEPMDLTRVDICLKVTDTDVHE